MASATAEDADRVWSLAIAVAGVVVREGCGGGDVKRVGWTGGGEGENSSAGEGGAMSICTV